MKKSMQFSWAAILLAVLMLICAACSAEPVVSHVSASPTATVQPTPESTPEPTPTPKPTPEPTPTETPEPGLWGEKFADKFTDGDVVVTDTSYQSADISITVTSVLADHLAYYVADIYVRDLSNFLTAFAGGAYDAGTAMTPDIADENGAIIAVSGDYYNAREKGIVIRNGELFRDVLFKDVLIMNNDGSMATYEADAFNIDAVKDTAYQGWSFGPMLLQNGLPMEEFNSKVNPKNPRCAIGYFEPGHYCFVLVDGRQGSYSQGLTMQELSLLMSDLGCQVAYNMDGGQSAMMTFMGKTVNQPFKGGRKVSDIIYIKEK